jgi:anti-sigma regulatory factor (Ser/Thr protein kinase)
MTRIRHFECDVNSVPESRDFINEALVDLSPEIRASVALMVSELATNAVVHARSAFVVTVDRTVSSVRVEVSDQGQGNPQVISATPQDPHGRGLRIVERLSDSWGIEGRSVWFTLEWSSVDSTGQDSCPEESQTRSSGRPSIDRLSGSKPRSAEAVADRFPSSQFSRR